MHLFHKKNFPNNANPPAAGCQKGAWEGASSPDNCCHSGTKVSLSALGGHFLPEVAAIWEQSASRG